MDLESILNDSFIPLDIKEKLSFLNNKAINLEIRLNFLQQILNQADDFILITNLAGDIEFANEKAKEFYGNANSDLTGYSCFLIKTMDGYPKFKEIVDKVNEEFTFQQVIPLESKWEGSDKIHYFSLKVSLITNEVGERFSLFWYGRDVTEAVKREMEVIESENFLNRLVSNIPGVVYRCENDKNWTMRYISEGAQRLFGYKPEDLINNNKVSFNTLIREDFRQIVWDKWQKDMETKVNIEFEYPIITASGEERWILDRSQKIEDDDGNVEFIEGIMLDITEKKKYEKKIIEAQKMDSIGNLAAGIAHDFNNMLTGILGLTDYLILDETNSEKKNDLKSIMDSALRAKSLTEKLLAFGRKGKNINIAVNLNSIASEVVSFLSRTIPSKIRINTIFDDFIDTIDADPNQMYQILMNLCINAIEAMPNGGILTIETKNELIDGEERVILSVRDTGVGMTEEVQHHLFEPFFSTKLEKEKKGTGLGLAVVYGIVKNHGGRIDYETEVGKGTAFKIIFKRGLLKPSEHQSKNCELNIKQKKILVVEDEEIIQKVLVKLLDSMDIPCICAQNGQMALEIYNKDKDTIKGIILDLKMPVMDGKTAFYELKKVNPNIKVIISTGYGENEEAQELLNAGAVGILVKPYRKDDLKSALICLN